MALPAAQHIIDDARVHFRLGGFTMFMPLEQAYLHIGIFLGWVIEHNLYSETFREEGETSIYRFRSHAITCIILGELWDGIVSYEQLNEEGQAFAQAYYESGHYLSDYKQVLAKGLSSMYDVEDSDGNYRKMCLVLDWRFRQWKEGSPLGEPLPDGLLDDCL
jgi:hypothetical protein